MQMSLNVAHNLFGVTFGVGVRNRAPRKGEQPVTMHHGDAVNMIDFTQNNAFDHNKELTCDQHVDLIDDVCKRTMKIWAHYGKFLAQIEAVGAASCMNSAELPQHVAGINIHHVVTGKFFMHQGF